MFKQVAQSTANMLTLNGTVEDENLVIELAQAALKGIRQNAGRVAGELVMRQISVFRYRY